MKLNIKIFVLILATTVYGCSGIGGDPKEKEVRQAVAEAARLINSTQHNTMAALAFASITEQGGSTISYLAANMPEDAKFTCYVDSKPTQSYCVYIRPGTAPKSFIIAGYGQDLEKPIIVETATAGMPRPGTH